MHENADIDMAATLEEEFDRQLSTLVEKGYPELAGISADQLLRLCEPLRQRLPGPRAATGSSAPGSIPFVIVVTGRLVPTVQAVQRFVVRGRPGFTDMADEIDTYQPIDGIDVPGSPVYLLLDIETGRDTLNVRPDDALPLIETAGRTLLTTDEGVALVTHFPKVLTSRNCFQVLGSRADNKRIPSFWVSKGAPRLGWCWAGNPHTWLGAASAAARVDAA